MRQSRLLLLLSQVELSEEANEGEGDQSTAKAGETVRRVRLRMPPEAVSSLFLPLKMEIVAVDI